MRDNWEEQKEKQLKCSSQTTPTRQFPRDYENLLERVVDRDKDKQALLFNQDDGVDERDRVKIQAELKDFKDKVSALEKEQKKQEAKQNKDLRLKSKLEDDITHAE
ncbi:Oidioi.mRNA.OKI2018_I69.chr2.g4831.t1.cds [Oikopleura dioica]|uniref:Oidioi.mRNA.OKI2018_I69.chr2.g4831.t1.cds n=1 Tax=Oikopleura dioica TaxID=34765 RepID=A0ABN7T428_OIKDI|nr:Oidioi.mRNA.OKI2018_I69.chr2.g4831.t1.cds [Oikopleura dioica]